MASCLVNDSPSCIRRLRVLSAHNGAVRIKLAVKVRDAKRSGRISGRAGIYLDFDRIRLRNGRNSE